MIKSVRELTDVELSSQCEKHNIECHGLRRADKIRSLMHKGYKSVYIPILEPDKKTGMDAETQTFVRQQYNEIPALDETTEYETVTEPLQSVNTVEKKSLTTNVVVTDAVHRYVAVQNDIHINGYVYLRDRILNPEPVVYLIESNNQVIYIDLSTNDYTFFFESTNNIDACITLTQDSKLWTGNKGLIKCVNKTDTIVSVKFDSEASLCFAITEPQTLESHSQFSFEYFVTSEHTISVLFVEETYESRSAILKRTSISEFKEFRSEDSVKLPSEYYNSLLVSKAENDGTSRMKWQYLNYFDPLVGYVNNVWIHYFKHYYGNYKIVVSDSYEYSTIVDEIPHIILGYFGYIDANETESEGMHGYIHVKNERSSTVPLIVGFSPYDYDIFSEDSEPFYGWSGSFVVSQSSFTLMKDDELLLEYTVVRTGVAPLIVAKQLNIAGILPAVQPDNSTTIVHVTYNKGKFDLYDHSNNRPLTTLERGKKYRFIYQDTSYNQHLLRFSNRNDGYFL